MVFVYQKLSSWSLSQSESRMTSMFSSFEWTDGGFCPRCCRRRRLCCKLCFVTNSCWDLPLLSLTSWLTSSRLGWVSSNEPGYERESEPTTPPPPPHRVWRNRLPRARHVVLRWCVRNPCCKDASVCGESPSVSLSWLTLAAEGGEKRIVVLLL